MAPIILLAVALLATPAQTRPQEDSLALALRIESAAMAADRAAIVALAAPGADREPLEQFATTLTWPRVSRIIIKERDRVPVEGGTMTALWEIFTERGIEGRVATWQAELLRDGQSGEWRIRTMMRLSNAGGLFRLTLDATRQYDVRSLTIRAPDLTIELPSGALFVSATPGGPTAAVLLGKGRMRFAPPDAAERTQVRIFSKHEALEDTFDVAFIRFRPAEFESVFKASALTARPVDGRTMRRAVAVFDEYIGKTLQIDLADLSRDRWSLIPPSGDFIAEIRTKKYGSLTYARSGNEAEDISVFDRRRRRNISVYASAEKLAERGRFYSDDDRVDYDVLTYEIETDIDPRKLWFDGNARLKIRVRSPSINTLNLKLAESLVVRGIYAPGLGRLLHLRVVGQNTVVINLPVTVVAGTDLWLNVVYSGRVESQAIDREAITLHPQEQQEVPFIPAEPRFLYSNRSYWYPQSVVTDYATLALRITVPAEYDVIASGHPVGSPVPAPGVQDPTRPKKMYVFTSEEPMRYIACAISRFSAVATADLSIPGNSATMQLASATPAPGERGPSVLDSTNAVRLFVQANPRQISRARSMTATAKDLFSFYGSLVGEAPYPSFTLAVSESDTPGGHSPPYFAVLNQSLPGTPMTWQNDPVSFEEYPTFFMAHEMAHQWWGQAVGWKNYHEQWISEGFAQYFAALYGQKEQGDDTFRDILRQMRSTAIQASSQGPIYLGYRLGHIKGEGRIFRSLVYNKAAMVLHMLRRFVGDRAFFEGLRAFYDEWRFRKAGTDDFRRAMEKVTGRDLERFFEDWIFGDTIPRVAFSYRRQNGTSVLIRLEQQEQVLQFPVTITLNYDSHPSEDIVIPVTERVTERTLPLKARLRGVDVNGDHAALVRIDR